MEMLKLSHPQQKINLFEPPQPLAVVWDTADGDRAWYIGFYIGDVEESNIRIDHLQLASKNLSNRKEWIRPSTDDIQEVKPQQLVICDIIGDWDFSKRRPTFVV